MGNKSSKPDEIRINYYDRIYKDFYNLCAEGSIEDISEYVTMYSLDLRKMYESVFIVACINDRLDVASWLYNDVFERQMNIHVNNDSMLKFITLYAPARIVEWFMSLDSFDYRANNDEIFHKICFNNRVKVAQYFEKICPNYRIELEHQDKDSDENRKIINYHVLGNDIDEILILNKLNILPVSSREKLNDECPICLEDCVLVLPCNHAMCVKCFYEWYYEKRKDSACHLCQNSFYYDQCVWIRT